MGAVWGNKIKLTIFGESHGKGIGIVIDGLPSGEELNLESLRREMERRAPGRNNLSTQRKEEDTFEILSGFFEGKTTGTPLCAVIKNNDKKSSDYSYLKDMPRPGHGDYTGFIKYSGFNDYRGGGHFSGRITAPLVFAGAIAKQVLEKKEIYIGSHIKAIENTEEVSFGALEIEKKELLALNNMDFPVLNEATGEEMRNCILKAKEEMDSVGGIIETAIVNVPEGLGDPFFNSVESNLAQLLFSIPAVKGVEFGKGFGITSMRGSQANDQYCIKNDKIQTLTNNNGGIIGGITNGMPIIFRTGIKPTPSISKEQQTVNLKERQESVLKIVGRHDPCIVQRAVPVVEAAAAITILDLIL